MASSIKTGRSDPLQPSAADSPKSLGGNDASVRGRHLSDRTDGKPAAQFEAFGLTRPPPQTDGFRFIKSIRSTNRSIN
jgi:hypothetical protein